MKKLGFDSVRYGFYPPVNKRSIGTLNAPLSIRRSLPKQVVMRLYLHLREKPERRLSKLVVEAVATDYRTLKLIINMAWNIDIAYVSFVAPADIKVMTRLTAMVVLCYYSNPSTVRNGGKQDRQNQFFRATAMSPYGT